MSLPLSGVTLAASAAIVLWVSSSTAGQPETIAELKLLQQRKLLEEPAERLENLNALRETSRAERPSTGYRSRPTPPQGTDLVPPAAPTLGTLQALAGLSANYRINDRTGEPFGACQSEVSIAAHGSQVVAAWNDGIGIYGPPTSPTNDTQGYGFSTDGGVTWVDGGAPPAPTGWIWASDPVVVVNDRTGAFYYSALIDNFSGGVNGIAVTKGVFQNGSFAWGTPTIIRSVANSASLLDKPWLAADSLTGNLYVAYSEFVIVGGQFVSDAIQFQRSTDDNQTWSSLQTLSSGGDAGLVQGARPGVGPDGELYVVWYAIGQSFGPGANSPYGRDFLRVRKSINGGISFASQVTADSIFSNFGSGAPGFNRGVGLTFPAIAVDRSQGPTRGRVHLAWNESLNFYNDPLPVPGQAPAQREVENNNAPALATPFVPGTILRGAIAQTGNPGDFDYWKWNATQGQTVIFYLDSLSSNLDASFRIFCSDGTTNLAFSQNGVGYADLLVFTVPTTATYYLRVASYSGIYVGGYRILTTLNTPQADRAQDHRDLMVASSADGTQWQTMRVNDSPPWFDDWLPEISVDGEGRAVLAAYDWRDSPDLCGGGSNVYLYVAEPNGAWGPGRRVSDVTTNWSTTYSTLIPNQGDYIGLFARDGIAHVAWADGREGDPDIETTTPSIAPTGLRADAGDDKTIECQGSAGTHVRLDGTGSTGATRYLWSAPGVTFDDATSPTATGSFPLGATVVTLIVSDGIGTSQDQVQVTVIDTSPPQVTVTLQPAELWPPNGALATVRAQVAATDVCDPSCTVRLVSIESDEPDSGTTPSDPPQDIQGANFGTADFEFQLRAERAPSGNGRIYTVCYEGQDHSGNVRKQCAEVRVPHDQSGRASLQQEAQNLRMIAFGSPSMPASSIDASSVVIGSADFLRGGSAGRVTGEADFDRDGVNDLSIAFDGPGSSNLGGRAPLYARWTAAGVGYLAELARGAPLGVESEPTDVFLARVTPNPSGDPLIRFALPHGGKVRLDVFDVTGQRVARVVDGVLSAGWHEARCRDLHESRSRLLLYRLEWEGRVINGKLVVLQ